MILRPQFARKFLPLVHSTARHQGAKGGRGGAKSHFFAEKAIMEAVTSHQRFVCAREIQNSIADSVKQLLEDKIHAKGLDSLFQITRDEIVCKPTDTLFVFKGLRNHTVASIKSLEGFTRLWIEEAQSVSKNSLDVAVPTFRTPGSQIWYSWNPRRADDPIEKQFAGWQDDPDFELVTVNYWDNPWFPDELRKDMERDRARDPDKYAHVWCGEFERNSEARVFHNWTVEEFNTPSDARFYFGADWGFAVDPTVLVRCFIDHAKRKLYIDQEAYAVGCEIDRTPTLFKKIEGSQTWPITADSARPETIDYMKRHGFPKMVKALKGPDSVKDGIEFLKNYDIIVHPRCDHTARELSLYSFKVDPHTNEILPVLEDKENHVIDAIRYAVETLRRAPRTSVRPISF